MRDPLEALKAPIKVEPVEDAADEFTSLPDLANFVIQTSDATLALEEFNLIVRKVITCYGCGEYAFDGSFTAFMTDDEGEQPFCPECVHGIEKRSAWQEETALPKAWTTSLSTDTKPIEFNLDFKPDSSAMLSGSNMLSIGDLVLGSSLGDVPACSSGDLLVSSGNDVQWTNTVNHTAVYDASDPSYIFTQVSSA